MIWLLLACAPDMACGNAVIESGLSVRFEADPLGPGELLVEAFTPEGVVASCAVEVPLEEGVFPSCEDGTYLSVDGDVLQGWFIQSRPEDVEIVISFDDVELAAETFDGLEYERQEYNMGCNSYATAEVTFAL